MKTSILNAQKTLSYYNPFVISKFQKEQNVSEQDSERIFRETLKFLAVSSDSQVPQTPSKIVDEMWHCFILFTVDYHEFCEEHFGRYIHHIPGNGSGEGLNYYYATRNIIKERFGIIDEFWPDLKLDRELIAECNGEGRCSCDSDSSASGPPRY